MIRYAILLSIAVGAGVLAYSLAANGFVPHSIVVAALGAGWLFLYMRGITRFSGLIFFIFGMISVLALWLGGSRWLVLTGMVFSLLAWDLTAFEQRLKDISNRDDLRKMQGVHFTRLAIVIGLALVGVVISRLIKIDLTLGSALIFVLLGIWGISALVYRLRSRE